MMQIRRLLLLSSLTLLAVACKKTNNNTPIPQISFIGMNKDSLKAKNIEDTVRITFSFYDGDGDLGAGGVRTPSYMVFYDNRDNDSLLFPFPPINAGIIDPAAGLEGRAIVDIRGNYVALRSDTLHQNQGDTVKYQFQVVDNSGNRSNKIDLPQIRLRP